MRVVTGNSFSAGEVRANDEDVASRMQLCVSMMSGMTATQIAGDIGVSISAVTKWLRTGRITRRHLMHFAFLYGISIEWLMSGIGPMKASDRGGAPSVAVYPLADFSVIGGAVVEPLGTKSSGGFLVEDDVANHFAVEASCAEVHRKLSGTNHLLFRRTALLPGPGRIVALARKGADGGLLLRVSSECADGSPRFVAESGMLATYSLETALLLGVCESVNRPFPTFF